MGSAGHAFVAHTKSNSPAAQNKDGGWGPPPHPKRIVRGQEFWPRAGKRKRPLRVRTVRGDIVSAVRLDQDGGTARLSRLRLLAARDDGQGLHYQFCAYRPGRYPTHAYVHSVTAAGAVLVLPDWHPRRPFPFPAALIPREAREAGQWMRCQADLGAPSAARLNLSAIKACKAPAEDVCHAPAYTPPADRKTPLRPEYGSGCGDIVLERSDGVASLTRRGGLLDVFTSKRPEGMRPGDRVYLAVHGTASVTGYLVVDRIEPTPNGALLRCQRGAVMLAQPIEIPGERQQNIWRWRWWPRGDLRLAAA